MEFKEAITELYTTLVDETTTEHTDKVGISFRYQELPGILVTINYTKDAVKTEQ